MSELRNNVNRMSDEEAAGILTAILSEVAPSTANMRLPDPDLRDFYVDETRRIIRIESSVESSTIEVVKKIQEYNRQDYEKDVAIEDRQPIWLYLDTPGGSVPVMWSIVQAIKMSKTPVYTVNLCSAMSAGAHILAAGHKRFGFPGSTVLVHNGSVSFSGTVEATESAKDYYDSISKKADELLLTDTKLDEKTLKSKKKKYLDWYLDTDEALKYGFIDEILTDFDQLYKTNK